MVLEGGWAQKRLSVIGLSDENKACHKEEITEKHTLSHRPEWNKVRREIPKASRNWEQNIENLKEGVEKTKRYCNAFTHSAKRT